MDTNNCLRVGFEPSIRTEWSFHGQPLEPIYSDLNFKQRPFKEKEECWKENDFSFEIEARILFSL